jgi:NADPH2:quinone reductase
MAKTYVSTVIDAPIARVWQILRDFRRVADYHSTVVEIAFPGDLAGDQVGCMRAALNTFGMRIVEQLTALSDVDHSGSYRIVEIEGPLKNLVAHFRLSPITDTGQTFIEWRSEFDFEGEGGVQPMIAFLEREVYTDCLNGLKRLTEAPEPSH